MLGARPIVRVSRGFNFAVCSSSRPNPLDFFEVIAVISQRAAARKNGGDRAGDSSMCELLGLCFNQPVNCRFSFAQFSTRGERNPHGWGLAYFDRDRAEIIKEDTSAAESERAKSLRNSTALTSHIFIGHVRLASVGDVNLENTHPFSKRFRGRDFVLAHNGTVRGDLGVPDLRFHPEGETDSERLLCALLTRLDEEDIPLTAFARIESILREFNAFGRMNLLFSEGDHLFCYRDQKGYNGLCAVHRRAPFGDEIFKDKDVQLYLPKEKHPSQRGYVIATEPLTVREDWRDIPPGTLQVYSMGKSVYP